MADAHPVDPPTTKLEPVLHRRRSGLKSGSDFSLGGGNVIPSRQKGRLSSSWLRVRKPYLSATSRTLFGSAPTPCRCAIEMTSPSLPRRLAASRPTEGGQVLERFRKGEKRPHSVCDTWRLRGRTRLDQYSPIVLLPGAGHSTRSIGGLRKPAIRSGQLGVRPTPQGGRMTCPARHVLYLLDKAPPDKASGVARQGSLVLGKVAPPRRPPSPAARFFLGGSPRVGVAASGGFPSGGRRPSSRRPEFHDILKPLL
jgi:hypothetical protein